MESRRLVSRCIHSWDSSCNTKRTIDRVRLYVHAITVTMQLDGEWRNALMRDLLAKATIEANSIRHSGRVVRGPRCWFLATMLRYCSAGGGSIKGGGMEPPGKKRWNLRSSFPPLSTNLASTPFTHTHDCLVNPPMSVYSSVPSSTWSPFFLSLYFLSLPPFPFLFLPFEYQFHLSRCDIRVSELWIDADKRPRSFHQAADYFPAYDKSEHSQIFAFPVIYQPLSLSFSFSSKRNYNSCWYARQRGMELG